MPTPYHVEITKSAQRDVAEIWEYIASDNPKAADGFVAELIRQAGTLASLPLRCPIIPETNELGVEYRHLIYGDYRTIFKILGRRVIILRIVHGARLLEDLYP